MRLGQREAVTRGFLALAIAGCAPLAPPTPNANFDIKGQVIWPAADRQVAATIGDVALAATVSLIDVGTATSTASTTVSSTVTTPSGGFNLGFGAGFVPDTTRTYVLEAVKGLSGNAAGKNAARVRTYLKYSAGWSSTSGIQITISPDTTALAVIQSLKKAANVAGIGAPQDFIGTLSYSGTVATFNAGTSGVTPAEYADVTAKVNQALGADNDPVATIKWNGTAFDLKITGSPVIVALDPQSGTVGSLLTIKGQNFDALATDNKVVFPGGFTGTIDAAKSTTGNIVVVVPAGATSGTVTVSTKSLLSDTANFTVIPIVGGSAKIF